jgi:hypothetical protein
MQKSTVRKNPLNMLRFRELTFAQDESSRGAGGPHGVPFGLFSSIIKGWSGLELSLTCPQGDFAEDPSEEGVRAKSSGTS